MTVSTRQLAETAAIQRLIALAGSAVLREEYPAYTRSAEQNLVPGISRGDFWNDLAGGDGSELVDAEGKPAKFCAAYSSSALAVNAFGPFRHAPENLSMESMAGFQEARFEFKCPTGLKGTPPNLDFYAAGSQGAVCVESKFLETLSPKEAKFRPSYDRAMNTLAEPGWLRMYESLLKAPTRFKYLDAAQLVKHYLGMRYTLRGQAGERVLLYVFWEPSNAGEVPEFRLHREEVAKFGSEVEGGQIRFMSYSYPELWEQWLQESHWDGMHSHVQVLRERYDFKL